MLKKVSLLVLILILLFSVNITYAGPKPAGELLSQKDAIEKLFMNRQLDPIEGIWYSTKWRDEYAIVKNSFGLSGFNYIGLYVKDRNCGNKGGDISDYITAISGDKLFSGKTASCLKHPLFGVMSKNFTGTHYVIVDFNTIQTNSEDRDLGQDIYVRLYPTAQNPATPAKQKSVTGSGFFIADKLIATNAHVVEGAKSIAINYKGEKTSAIVYKIDKANDIAILEIQEHLPPRTPLPIVDSRTVRQGDDVYTVGFPLPDLMGTNSKMTNGLINSTSGLMDDQTAFQISVPIQPGNSGGPLINVNGDVVGLVNAKLNELYTLKYKNTIPQNVNFAIKSNYLIAISPNDFSQPSQMRLTSSQIAEKAEMAVVLLQVER